MKILIVEDDPNLLNGISTLLLSEGYHTLLADNGEHGLEIFRKNRPDFCVLDIMMPKMDGFELCRKIRQYDERVPVLFLSARGDETDKVVGLELGADDFVIKPFNPRELVARIRAIYRRSLPSFESRISKSSVLPKQFNFGPFCIDVKSLRAVAGNRTVIDLSRRELMILWLLKQKQGEVVTRDMLFDFCWGRDYLPSSRALDQQICVLRGKIEIEPKNPVLIQTVHKEGYRFEF